MADITHDQPKEGGATPSEGPLSRPARREKTHAAIAHAARGLFAEQGYDRVSIRGIAARAGVDPALVMQHFGSKEQLFAQTVEAVISTDSLVAADIEELAAAALTHVFENFEGDSSDDLAALAMLRSSLTHPAAGAATRDIATRVQAQLSAAIGTDDADLRAAILNACTLGMTVARYLLRDPIMASAGAEEIRAILTPALAALVTPMHADHAGP